MNTKVNFSKIKKCDQVWERMEATPGGRMCQKCSHKITDFRGMTDWEIAVIHAHSKTKVCGLYDDRIMNPKSTSSLGRTVRKLAVPSMIGLCLTGTDAAAQSYDNTPQEQLERSEVGRYDKEIQTDPVSNVSQSSMIVRGTVLDHYGEALTGANVLIEGTHKGTITDIDGSFELDISFKKKSSVSLIVSFIAFDVQSIEVNKSDFGESDELVLDPVVLQHNFEMDYFGIVRESKLKRFWRGVTNIFRKKKR